MYLCVCCYGKQDLVSFSVSMTDGDRIWQQFWVVVKLEDSLDLAAGS